MNWAGTQGPLRGTHGTFFETYCAHTRYNTPAQIRVLRYCTFTQQWRTTMVSEPIRDSANDHLLTPDNSALITIDYQPLQVNSIASMDRQRLVNNIVGSARAAVAYCLSRNCARC